MRKIKSFFKAVFRFFKGGLKAVPIEIYEERFMICNGCPHINYNKTRCTICGCKLSWKMNMPEEECPKKYWRSYNGKKK